MTSHSQRTSARKLDHAFAGMLLSALTHAGMHVPLHRPHAGHGICLGLKAVCVVEGIGVRDITMLTDDSDTGEHSSSDAVQGDSSSVHVVTSTLQALPHEQASHSRSTPISLHKSLMCLQRQLLFRSCHHQSAPCILQPPLCLAVRHHRHTQCGYAIADCHTQRTSSLGSLASDCHSLGILMLETPLTGIFVLSGTL